MQPLDLSEVAFYSISGSIVISELPTASPDATIGIFLVIRDNWHIKRPLKTVSSIEREQRSAST